MRSILILSIGITLATFGCDEGGKGGGGGSAVDQTKPEAVVAAIFAAAQSGEVGALKGLCDPKKENDKDTQSLCDMTKEDKRYEEFKTYFGKGKVEGAAVIEGDKAEVKFKFGPDGSKDETMKMVQRDGKWYLSSF